MSKTIICSFWKKNEEFSIMLKYKLLSVYLIMLAKPIVEISGTLPLFDD